MSRTAAQARDIIIGILLLLIGGATLAHTMGWIALDEQQAILYSVYGLLGLGGLLVIAYLIRPKSFWPLMLALCLFFIAGAIYIGTFRADLEALIPSGLFLLAALAFFVYFIVRPSQWWAMLCGWIALGLAGVIYTEMRVVTLPWLNSIPSDSLPPLVLFSSVALGFFFVWIMSPRERWWAIMVSGLVIAVESTVLIQNLPVPKQLAPALMFAIAGLSFFLVWLLRNEDYSLQWAIYPAAVLIGFSAFLYMVTYWMDNSRMVLAMVFITVGVLFIANFIRSTIAGRREIEKKVATYSATPTPDSSSVVGFGHRGTSTAERESLFVSEEPEEEKDVFATEVEAVAAEPEDDAQPPADYAADESDEMEEEEDTRKEED